MTKIDTKEWLEASENYDLDDYERAFAFMCKSYDEAQKEIERLKVFEDFVKTAGPFEIVSGDCIHRTSPSSRQVLNTNTNWLVSQDSRQFSRSTMSLKKLLDTIRIQKELGEG